jgi:hypothetical protein
MTVVAVAWWVREGFRWAFWVTLGIGAVAQIALIGADAEAYRLNLPFVGPNQADPYHRTLGWRELGLRTVELAKSTGARTVVADDRADVAALIYYLRREPLPVRSWQTGPTVEHHFDLTRRLDDATATEPVLFVSNCPLPARLERFFQSVTPLGAIIVRTGPTTTRPFPAFKLVGRRRPIGPLGACGDPVPS